MTSISPPINLTGRSNWFGPRMPWARWALIINLCVPMALLIWDAWHNQLGPNAPNFAIHTTGSIAIVYLLLSLVITPLRMITGLSWLVQFRRSLGVYAFYYAAAHLAIYFWWDMGASVSRTAHAIISIWYLAVGFTCLVIMAALWSTSFDAAIRKMGGRNWKWLHRLTYIAAILACLHFYAQSKADKRKPILYFSILGFLLLWRAVAATVRFVRAPSHGNTVSGKARFWKGRLRVVDLIDETPSVRTFRMAAADGGQIPFHFAAGQFLNLSIEIEGKRISRSYTIASPPTRDGYVDLTIKREENGLVSQYLHDKLLTGHPVTVSAPSGRFSFDSSNEQAVLLIAGGVGITPVMSILRYLTDQRWAGKIDLIFSVRSPADVIFATELETLTSKHPNLRLHLTYTRAIPSEWPGSRGRISVEMIRTLVPDFAARRAFICGPDAMARAVRDELRTAGVPEGRITLESFTPGTGVTSKVASGAHNIDFARAGRSAVQAAGKTVLDAAESAGIPIDYECRSGICGTCRCKLLSGSVTMAVRDALSDADEDGGYILACQAYAREDLTIDA